MPAALSTTDTWNANPTGPVTGESHTATMYRDDLGQLTENETWLHNRMTEALIGTFHTFEAADVDTGTDEITIPGHGIASNTVVRVTSVGGTIPTNLSSVLAQYVIVVDADTIQLSATSGPGAAINIASTGSGTMYLWLVPDVLANLVVLATTISGNSVAATNVKALFALCMSTLGGTFVGAPTLSGVLRLLYTSRSLTRVQTGILWESTFAKFSPSLLNVAAGETAYQKLDRLPNGSTITAVNFYHNRDNLGILPTTRVTAQLYKTNITTGVNTSIAGPTEDPTAVLASYEAYHSFSLSGLAEVVDNTLYSYYVEFVGEAGANTTFTLWYPVSVTCTVTDQDEMA
jgi:hypothetical protein